MLFHGLQGLLTFPTPRMSCIFCLLISYFSYLDLEIYFKEQIDRILSLVKRASWSNPDVRISRRRLGVLSKI